MKSFNFIFVSIIIGLISSYVYFLEYESVVPSIEVFETPAVLGYVEKINGIASHERPTLASARAAWAMAWIHLVIWNSWKSAYFYADKFTESDIDNYVDYALLSLNFLVDHHEAEETVLFPELDKRFPGSMIKNHEQHESFLQQLISFIQYMDNVKDSTEPQYKFDAIEFKARMSKILAPVMQHLAEELDTLAPSVLLQNFTEEEIEKLNKATHIAQQNQGSSLKMLPFILQNLPHNSPFPPAPKFVTKLLGPWVFYWKFQGLWKYTAYPLN